MEVPELTALVSLEQLVMTEPEVTALIPLEPQVSALIPLEPEVMAEPHLTALVALEPEVLALVPLEPEVMAEPHLMARCSGAAGVESRSSGDGKPNVSRIIPKFMIILVIEFLPLSSIRWMSQLSVTLLTLI